MVVILARSIFCRPISLQDIFILNNGFHISYLALAGSHISLVSCLGGVNDPSM
jgi:hypothetical protein